MKAKMNMTKKIYVFSKMITSLKISLILSHKYLNFNNKGNYINNNNNISFSKQNYNQKINNNKNQNNQLN